MLFYKLFIAAFDKILIFNHLMSFQEKIRKNNILLAFLMAGIFIFLSIIIQASFYYRNNPERLRNNFYHCMTEKEIFLNAILEKFARVSQEQPDLVKTGINKELCDLYDSKGFVFFVFENDSVVYWSQNSVEFPVKLLKSENVKSQIIRLSNGWYESIEIRKAGVTYIGLILIKSEFPFENDFLKNNFQKDKKINP